jgi:DNA (cytosine-5)-methyltransferase 1
MSFFSGAGGGDLAFPRDKYNIIGYSEIDKYSSSILRYHEQGIKNYGDITKIKAGDLPDFDVCIGGSPCTDVSISGKREGITARRSGLFFNYIEIIKQKQPKYFIFENVAGLFNSNGGWDFARVQIEMAQAGYDVEWMLLNSRYFGVPQNRERVFVVGYSHRHGGRALLSKRRDDKKICKDIPNEQQGQEEICERGNEGGVQFIRTRHLSQNGTLLSPYCHTITASEIPHIKINNVDCIGAIDTGEDRAGDGKNFSRNFRQGNRVHSPVGIAPCLNSNTGNSSGGSLLVQQGGVVSYGEFKERDIVNCIDANYWKGADNHGQRTMVKEVRNDLVGFIGESHQATRVFRCEGSSPTLSALGGGLGAKTGLYKIGPRIRRLTPIETERLMSWPDNFTKRGIDENGNMIEISDTQRYKICGNGIVTKVLEWVIRNYLP